MEIYELLKGKNIKNEQEVKVVARVRSNRPGKAVGFLVINDGTSLLDLQVVYKSNLDNFNDISQVRVSSIIEVIGKILLTPDKEQKLEIQAEDIVILDEASQDYPLQKKEHSLEFLREISHLRSRTKTFQSIFKIRSVAAYAIHRFFQEENYVYVTTPIITENDAEGAGESFIVTTLKNDEYEKDFFGKKACLTVSGQLNGEAYAQAFKKIYTFGPTFRAENSNTSKHAAEFWMIEPEIAFEDLNFNIALIEKMIKFIINEVFNKCSDELEFCDKNLEKGLINKLKHISNSNFERITYTDAIEVLKKAVDNGQNFEEKNIFFGLDLGTEHERFLCEKHFEKPTFITNYPKEIKAFYMKQNSDGKTVAATDLLVPGIGELVGGSQREDNYEKLVARCEELKIDVKGLSWYNELRNFGYYKSSGFGLGFERLIMYITGASNIRDVIPFPRTPRNLLF
ncbi:asparagine--tRNA ligase [Spiroplasma turonicum]|uniref:Asparagine--tRNA ligase n=1 Tax=Spiroplasma turonicum TaxID=216946 RepID=A0A0K1P5Y4_9MOLU|nr:asparagine--tRNA ligase [Spiroplasma turonicum]AKU79332.1 asparaginyl-tRNA synthetase [Spiroplasma turonicum]ALX70353.1 asparaginyl-tRNA synthetase [Spiroplasma turonicum]